MLGTGGTVAAAKVVLTADTRDLSSGLARARREAHSTFDQIGRGALSGSGALHGLGRAALYAGGGFLGAAGLTIALRGAFHEMEQSQKVAAQTEAVLKSTGGSAGVTAKHVDGLAKSLMTLSGVDDENIKSGENWLLTFKNIRNEAGKNNDIFDQATKATLDLAAAQAAAKGTQIDMASASTLMGKALNDPVRGVTALQRVGVQFTAAQRELIKSLVESGHTLEAQKVILGEVNSQVAGSAEAFGNTLPGKISIMRESIKNLGGELLQTLAPAITTAVTKLTEWVGWLATSERFHAALRKGIDGLVTAFEKTRMVVQALIPVFKGFWDVVVEVGRAVVTITRPILKGFQDIFAVFQSDGGDPGHGKSTMRQLHDVAKTVGDILHNYVVPAIRLWSKVMAFEIKVMAKVVETEVGIIVGVIRGVITIVRAVESAVRAMVTTFRSSWGAVTGIVSSFVAFLAGLPGVVREKSSAIGHAVVSGVAGGLRGLVGGVRGMFGDLWDWIRGTASDSAKAIARNIGVAIVQGIIDGIGSIAGRITDAVLGPIKGAFHHSKNWLGNRSPSRRARDELGIPLGQGIIAGVEESLSPLGAVIVSKISTAHSMGREAIDAARGGSTGSGVTAPRVQEDKKLAVQIDSFLRKEGSPMYGQGAMFVAAGRKHGVDPRYLVALAGAESSFGKHCFRPFNPFGWMSGNFGSWAEAIFTVAAGLATGPNYFTQGRKSVAAIAAVYAPVGASNDPHGTNAQEPVNVSTYLSRLGGDPGNVTYPRGAGAGSNAQIPRHSSTIGGVHPTSGLEGYPALDVSATPGSPVLSPENGQVLRTSGHNPSEGSHGAAGVYGWTIYILGESGTTYFMTHFATLTVGAGARVRKGQVIGTVANFEIQGRPSHIHVGVNRGSPVGLENLIIGSGKTTAPTGTTPSPAEAGYGGGKSPPPPFGGAGGKTPPSVTGPSNRRERAARAAVGALGVVGGLAGVFSRLGELESGVDTSIVKIGGGLGKTVRHVRFTPTVAQWRKELVALKNELKKALRNRAALLRSRARAMHVRKMLRDPALIPLINKQLKKLDGVISKLRAAIGQVLDAIGELVAEAKANEEDVGAGPESQDAETGEPGFDPNAPPAATAGDAGSGDVGSFGGGGGEGEPTETREQIEDRIRTELKARMEDDWRIVLTQRSRFLREFASNTFTGQPGAFGYGTDTLPVGKPGQPQPRPLVQNITFNTHPHDSLSWGTQANWAATRT